MGEWDIDTPGYVDYVTKGTKKRQCFRKAAFSFGSSNLIRYLVEHRAQHFVEVAVPENAL